MPFELIVKYYFACAQQNTAEISLEGLPLVQAITLHCRDKRKGFGFQIEKYKEDSRTYMVIVSNITRGGVADTSGQLKVGDQILSVDGTNTLSCAMEKVLTNIHFKANNNCINYHSCIVRVGSYTYPTSCNARTNESIGNIKKRISAITSITAGQEY